MPIPFLLVISLPMLSYSQSSTRTPNVIPVYSGILAIFAHISRDTLLPSLCNMLKRLCRKRSEVKSVGQTVGLMVCRGKDGLKFGDPVLEDIYSHFSDLEPSFASGNCLERHKITDRQRAKMVDWMIEVTAQFSCATQTFYLSVSLLDAFFARYPKPLPPCELHVLGVTAMFISSKLEDVYPLRLRVVQEKITSGKLSDEKIKATETLILKILDYTMTAPTPWDSLSVLFTLFEAPKVVEKTAECVLRISLYFYDTLEIPASRRALASFVIACTCSNKVGFVQPILNAVNVREADLREATELLYFHVCEFNERFPEYQNCSRFLGFHIVSQVPGPLFRFDEEELEREQRELFEGEQTAK